MNFIKNILVVAFAVTALTASAPVFASDPAAIPACCVGGNCCVSGKCCTMAGCCKADKSCCDPAKGACKSTCGCLTMHCCPAASPSAKKTNAAKVRASVAFARAKATPLAAR